jgi:tRNA(Ile)-lysidine synthase
MPVAPPVPQLTQAFSDLLRSGTPVGLAVSGGGDSIALLHLCAALGGPISVASVDHGLRDEAAAECAMVAEVCAGYGFAHKTLRWSGWDHSGNLQEKARTARYALLADWGKAVGLCDIALGHTSDDQAETVIMALARGAGVDGLAGMAPVTTKHGLHFHRPLLHTSRADLRAYLTASGHSWRDDPSNADLRYERIRIRQAAGLLAGLGLTSQALGRVAQHMAAAAQALDRQTADLAAGYLLHQNGDVLVTLALDDLTREQARRLVLAAMGTVNRSLLPPRKDEQSRLMAALHRRAPAMLGGCVLTWDGPVLRVSRELAAVRDHATATHQLWDGRWRLIGPHDAALQLRAPTGATAACRTTPCRRHQRSGRTIRWFARRWQGSG